MRRSSHMLICAALSGSILAGTPGVASAYSPDNHELYTMRGAKLCERVHGVAIGKKTLAKMIEGVREPDDLNRHTLQMIEQRFERNSYGKQRDISVERIAAQAIHGSPNPTRPKYGNSAADREKLARTIRMSPAKLLPKRFALDVYSYDTNRAVRNKILITASQFLCVSFAHKKDGQSARKFGNMIHMIGDTYSASHVQRSQPTGSPGKCGTEKIEWHFSMDLIAWKQHVPADEENKDWRFRCIVEHTSSLMKLWAKGREAVRREISKQAKLRRANEHVRKSMILLCNNVLREDANILNRPAGGAAAGYSSASGTDNWEFFRKKKPDQAIQPVGLTGADEAIAFRKMVNDRLRANGSKIRFWYPSREMKDLCRRLGAGKPLPAPLKCTAQEIDWAMQDSDEVRTMWLPPRVQP
jgi:hypothetical protein